MARVTVQVAQPVDVAIRVPGWTGRDCAHFTIDARPQDVPVQGSFARVRAARLQPGCRVMMTFDLPERVTKQRMPVPGRRYHLRWRGDENVGVHPRDRPRPFYPACEPPA